MLTVLFLGDIVGEPGRNAVIGRLPGLKEKQALDFIIVNGENAAGGRGITGKNTIERLRAGVSVVTTGRHISDQQCHTVWSACPGGVVNVMAGVCDSWPRD